MVMWLNSRQQRRAAVTCHSIDIHTSSKEQHSSGYRCLMGIALSLPAWIM
jgi:hypothetical protein